MIQGLEYHTAPSGASVRQQRQNNVYVLCLKLAQWAYGIPPVYFTAPRVTDDAIQVS